MNNKVLIVDDERLERLLIQKSYDWEKNGFEIIGEASDGDEAIQMIQQYQPDIVFTDINMPFRDGLEFCTWLNEHFPHILVVIITGFRKFEYAQKAIQLGVKEFLLKPIQKDDLHQILERCKEELVKKAEQQIKLKQLEVSNYEQQKMIEQHYLERIILGMIDVEVEREKLITYEMAPLLNGGICLNVRLDDISQRDRILKEIENIPIQGIHKFVFTHTPTTIIVVLSQGEKTKQFNQLIELFIQKLKEILIQELNLKLSIIVGENEEGVEGISKSYYQTMTVLTNMMAPFHQEVMTYQDYLSTSHHQLSIELNSKELVFSLENGLNEKVHELLTGYITGLSLDMEMVKLLSMNVVAIFIAVLKGRNKGLADVFGSEQLFYSQLSQVQTMEAMNDFLKDSADQMMRELSEKKGKKGSRLIEEAKVYMDEHLFETDLSLKTIAAYLFVNESYLSRTFKKNAGESIIEYITAKRIKKSIELLSETDLKAYQIAEQVGIEDPHYFGICFKKYTGKTIKQFKESLYVE